MFGEQSRPILTVLRVMGCYWRICSGVINEMIALINLLTDSGAQPIVAFMRAENLKAVEALRERIRAKEEEARQIKIVVNSFYTDEGEEPPYPNVAAETTASLGSLRTDHFYGNTLAEAAQLYLEMRKTSGLGSASVNDIYAALKTGGYAFETKKEDYAKNGVRISLRKNPSIFHQLPGGDYGLSSWYGVKGPKEESSSSKKKGGQRRKRPTTKAPPDNKTSSPSATPTQPESNGDHQTAAKTSGIKKTVAKALEIVKEREASGIKA